MPASSLSIFTALRRLHESSHGVRAGAGLDRFLHQAAALVVDGLGWGAVVIDLHRRPWDDFVATTVSGPHADEAQLGDSRPAAHWARLLDARFEYRGAYLVPGGAASGADPDESWHPRDLLFVPTRDADGTVNGILRVGHPATSLRPADTDLDALVIVAQTVGATIDGTRHAEHESEHRAALEQLLAVSSRFAEARSPDAVLQAVCHGIRDALGFQRVAVILPDADGRTLQGVAAAGWNLADEALHIELPLDRVQLLMAPEYERQGCYLLEHERVEQLLGPSRSPYESERNGHGPWAWNRHWLLVPLRDREGRPIGEIWVDEPADRLLPTTPKLQALRLFADQAQAALASALQFEQAVHAAAHDGLTGLPNRRTLLRRLDQRLQRADNEHVHAAVLFIDLDRFKVVNDTYGHEAGDEVLRTVSGRIDELVRPGDVVARLGGDEFVVLCSDVPGSDGAAEVAGRLRAAIAAPITLESGDVVAVTASVGVAVPSGQRDTAQRLLRDADVAMYRVKDSGRDGQAVASTALRAGARARAELERALRTSLEGDQMSVVWQPIVVLGSGEVDRVEALLRWQHPVLGPVPPSEFLPLAEASGMILELGRWVLSAACRQAADWRERFGAAAPDVAVNLSPRQLLDAQLTSTIRDLLHEHQLPAGVLHAEITEGVLLDGGRATGTVLDELQQAGVSVELDDFGTGHSSLSSLERFQVDGIKIDGRFISGTQREGRGRAVVEALLMMARALGLRATAEGVETSEQLAWLLALGCTYGQGRRFADAAPAEALDPLLAGGLTPPTRSPA